MKRPPGKNMLDRARRLRREMTDAEALLWRYLRARQLNGFKFRREMWLHGFLADFACVEAKLVIEADGRQHADQAEYDDGRSTALTTQGWRVLRFWNHDILSNIDGVLHAISEALPSPSHAAAPRGPLPLPDPGEGGVAQQPSPNLGRGRDPLRQQWEGEGR